MSIINTHIHINSFLFTFVKSGKEGTRTLKDN